MFAYLFAGDVEADAVGLAEAFSLLLDTNLAPDAYGSIRIEGNSVLVLAASDSSVRARLDELFGDFGEEVFTTGS